MPNTLNIWYVPDTVLKDRDKPGCKTGKTPGPEGLMSYLTCAEYPEYCRKKLVNVLGAEAVLLYESFVCFGRCNVHIIVTCLNIPIIN